MDLMKYDFVTRCRGIFAISIGMLSPGEVSLEEDFFINLHKYANDIITEDRKRVFEFALIIPSKRVGNRRQFYEDEKTVADLYKIVDEVKTIDQYTELLDTIEPRQVQIVSNLASEYLEFLDSFNKNAIHTFYPQ